MILADRWADKWIDAWNRRDLEAPLALYAPAVEMRSPFAKVYAVDGMVCGIESLRDYWGEAMRRMPRLRLEKRAVYSGHLALTLHYEDDSGRNCVETFLFDKEDRVVFETACYDRLR
ncbi:nuclear transport factor 2 family protein [Sphingomonas sp. So64.6b]|uniref:nuclear transport factor 2 family protein n=1 Tax=Sphingomonas sp. So64.6b TaxID=2997354 RepID=UPI0016021CB1|nr:nuclear transport factor 2 family protein [Sphingomonas sp. So64.6b]QNA85435.1 nuclear transport factor 2 family protein [Sphingomonas sp. So64.6b]